MEGFWDWDKADGLEADIDMTIGEENCKDFDKELWFELGKNIWKKYRRFFQDHVKYIHNNIIKPFNVIMLHYVGQIHKMHDIDKQLPPPSKKGDIFDQAYWKFHDYEFMEDEIRVATKDGLPTYMHDDTKDKDQD